MMTTCNTTLEDLDINEEPLWEGGLKFHHLGLILSALFGLISIVIALFLVFQHATHYLKPFEQKHIIRILLMIPVYSAVSFLSYLYYKHAVYFQVLRDCYEAFAIASFFTLLCHYIAPNLHEQKNYFRALTPVNWFWSVFGLQKCTGGENRGPFRKPRSGLTWFNVVWIGVFQYCCIRVLFTIVSVVTEVFDRYCEHSLSPAFGHIWVTVFNAASVTVAMFCLIQFYIQLRVDLAEHKPFMKVLCIKLVIFFSFWQTLVISFLASAQGPLQPSKKINYPDIYVGIPSMLLCIEMAFFAVLHLFAFSWKPYSLEHSKDPTSAPGSGYSGAVPLEYKGGPLGLYAFADAFNPWDIIKASARGFRWLFVGVKHRHNDSSYTAPAGNKVGTMDGYIGPLHAGNGSAATELQRPGTDNRGRDRGDTLATDLTEDDRQGLLVNSAASGRGPSTSPYRTYSNDEYAPGDDSAHLGGPSRTQMPASPPKHLDYGAEDTGYHGTEQSSSNVHPALRSNEADPNWNIWAGAHGAQRDDDEESMRPPTYRTQDPRQ